MKVKGGSRKEVRGDIPGRRNSTGKRYRRGGGSTVSEEFTSSLRGYSEYKI